MTDEAHGISDISPTPPHHYKHSEITQRESAAVVSGGLGCGDRVAVPFQKVDHLADAALGIAAAREVVGTRVVVEDAGGQNVPDGGEQAAGHGDPSA